jgi:Coenzyme PQQ synthesis protein D (PqqD)
MNEIYLTRSSAVAARELGGEMMIMSATDSTLCSLNETATIIWQTADGKTSLAEIVEKRICQEFNVEPEVAYRDALELVEELAALGILLLSKQPTSGACSEVTQKS